MSSILPLSHGAPLFSCSVLACADPGIFVRGGPGQSDKNKLWQRFFFFFFSVLSIFYRSQLVKFKEIYHFSRFQRESNLLQGGSNFFQGVQLLIPYRNPYNLWFSRGGPDPLSPPLDPNLTVTSVLTLVLKVNIAIVQLQQHIRAENNMYKKILIAEKDYRYRFIMGRNYIFSFVNKWELYLPYEWFSSRVDSGLYWLPAQNSSMRSRYGNSAV